MAVGAWHRILKRQLRLRSLTMHLAGCFLLTVLTTSSAGAIYAGDLIWVANGILLTYLLLAPRRLWPAYLLAALFGHVLGTAIIGAPWQVNVIDTPLDLGGALVCATLLRKRSAQLPRFTQRAYLIRFLLIAGLAVPLVSSFTSTVLYTLWLDAKFSFAFLHWAASDALGACMVTPACVAIFRARRNKAIRIRSWPMLLIFIASVYVILSQSQIPLRFLLFPLLVWVLLRSGLEWASIATLFVAAVGSWYTVHGLGPFAESSDASKLESTVVLQLFVASAMFVIYSVSVVLENLRSTEGKLRQIATMHKLLMDNSRDVIIVADFNGNRSFVSESGKNWGGWTEQELKSMKTIDLVHPEDLSRVESTLLELRNGKDGSMIECRAKTRNSGYVWMELNFRTIRNPKSGQAVSLLYNARDITERKQAEQQLQEAYKALESLAVTDALTGLANRRQFDQYLATEWRRGTRDKKPLSLLLIDVDFFKSYNDTYGHLRGDSCLKSIAQAARSVIARSGDLVARFGGEEFAVVLPNTERGGAYQIAQDICAVIRSRKLAHSSNAGGIVTVSVGCHTMVPQRGLFSNMLIDRADKALYQAKGSGRNCVCCYEQEEGKSPTGDNLDYSVTAKSQ
jgi:diguanylate cyclase (GGDEF)-like protein/PAS domain S-box-containing protein